MALAELERLLKGAIGLDAASIGRSAIERAIGERRRVCKVENDAAYLAAVRSSDAELQGLIEAVVVPETWFFRDGDAFTALGSLLARLGSAPRREGPVRALSLPCSTGEEPYSMVMAALDAGLSPERILVDAVDVSDRALEKARRGVYGRGSFRGREAGWRDRHFETAGSEYRVAERVSARVRFRQGNILRPATLPATGYDVIFCRNLLIYFDRDTQKAALDGLAKLLAADGLLFVGAAESGLLTALGFVSARLPNVTAFRKPGAPTAGVRRIPPPVPAKAAEPIARVRAVTEVPVRPQASPAPPAVADAAAPSHLDVARQLANEGRFVEAATWCEEHLRRQGPSAQAFHLLGLVRDAAADPADAARNYRKALYLDPHHHEALIHLALLMDLQNNHAEGLLLRNRARRAAEHGRA